MSEYKAIGLSKEEANTSTVRQFNIAVQEHTIFVGGTELSDRKELKTVQIPRVGKISTLRHTRNISDQQYTLIEKSVNNQVRKTETITPMTPKEVLAFKEKWQIMWHPEMTEEEILDQMDQEKILDQFDQEEHINSEPKIHNKVEAMPYLWCCCLLKGVLVYLLLFQVFQLELT